MRSRFYRHGVATALIVGASCASRPAAAQYANIPQEVVNNVIQNIIQNVRDQIQRRRVVPPAGALRFSGEEADFDKRDPFAAKGVSNPFAALAYAKAPALVAPPPASWLYGVNLIGSGDGAQTSGIGVSVATITGAGDITKIGIFTATDALTFIGTGSHSWAHTFAAGAAPTITDGSIPSTSGTLAYINGGFSADFTALASWTHNTSNVALVAGAGDTSGIAYTFNAQYRFDFPYTVWIEPTGGVTYSESYTGSFGTKTGDSTEVHGGARAGFETKWIGFTIQPSISGQYYEIVDSSGAIGAVAPLLAAAGAGVKGTYGFRGSGKINVLWTPQLSSFLEAHGSSIVQPKTGLPATGGAGTTIAGAQAGIRYTW